MNKHSWSVILIACYCSPARAQQLPGLSAPPTPAPSPSALNVGPSRSDVYFGSVPTGAATPDVLPLSLADAIARGLKYNLGVITSGQNIRASRAARLRDLSQLLPNLTAGVSETRQQVNLAAFGFSGFPGVPQVVGPFNVFDARAYLTQSVLDFTAITNHPASNENVKASEFAFRDAQDTVVVVAVNLYLQAGTGASRSPSALPRLTTPHAL